MSQIQIGVIHKLNIPLDVHENSIDWINQRSKKFFSVLKEIDGKRVMVKTRTRTDLSKYIVSLVDLPQDTFHVLKKYLEIDAPEAPVPCSCLLNILVNRGCQCGAFQKEKEKKS